MAVLAAVGIEKARYNYKLRLPRSGKVVRETEAEAIAFVVGRTIGLETGRAAADYIHLYARNAALLTESLEVIQKTSAFILSPYWSAR
jgi:hypothetical protein